MRLGGLECDLRQWSPGAELGPLSRSGKLKSTPCSDSDSGLQPYCLWQDVMNIRQVYGNSRRTTGKYALVVSLAIDAQFMRRRLKVRRY